VGLHTLFVVRAAVPGCFIARTCGDDVVGAGQIIEELGEAGTTLSGDADELTASSAAMAEDANGQAAAVEQISAALHEFSSLARANSDSLSLAKARQLACMRLKLGEIE